MIFLAYCPYCGGKVNRDEVFCIQCGEKLPADYDQRMAPSKIKVGYWTIPIIIFFIMLMLTIGLHFFLNYQTHLATEAYHNAEDHLIQQEYDQALIELEQAISYQNPFASAESLHRFTKLVISFEEEINKESDYQIILQLINKTKNELNSFSGEAVDQFLKDIKTEQISIQLDLVKAKLADEPNIESLPAILWEVEGVQDPLAFELASSIKEQIVAYTSAEVNKLLQEKQFSKAQISVENGLYYVPNSAKLTSLSSVVSKEKDTFESAQEERMEQAITAYEEEHDINQNDAVELVDVQLKENDQGHLVVTGQLKSVATIPINTVVVHYTITDQTGEVIDTNEIYVYPDTLYPEETGKFDYTYFDLDQPNHDLTVTVDTITWFLN